MASKRKNTKDLRKGVLHSETILQLAGEGICVIDKNGKILLVNQVAGKLLGGASADFQERRYDEVFFGKTSTDDDLLISPIQFVLNEGETSKVNSEIFRRLNGTRFWVEYICVPIKQDDEIIGAVLTFQDISERRDLENALEQARDAALAAVRAKASFLANMSHEIRTPLNGVIGTTYLLMNTELSEKQKEYLRILQSGSTLLLDLVNDILDFSKIEAGRLELEPYEFNLREVLAETIVFFKREAEQKGLILKSEISENVGNKFIGDGGRLRQILNNLIGNSLKFTETGEVCLKVFETENQHEKNVLRFEISDTGIGIAQEETRKLFQPFTQADVSTTRRFGGTGLGLAISKELVEMMNGEIGVQSRLGKGSTFWFTVELKSVPEISALDIPVSADENLLPNGERMLSNGQNDFQIGDKILLAEDNEVSRRVTSEILSQIGFSVKTAKDGAEAVKMCRNEKFDIILMDCQMPQMDGYEATKKIRETEKINQKTRIVAMTANVSDEEREKCLLSGMDDYLTKPLTKEILTNFFGSSEVFDNFTETLDLDRVLVQDLADLIEEKTLRNFLEIEARGNEDFAFEMLNLYVENAESLLTEFQNALGKRDDRNGKKIAHSLKGSSSNVGLTRTAEFFKDLETAIETRQWKDAEAITEKILVEHERIKYTIFSNGRKKYES